MQEIMKMVIEGGK